MSTELIARRIRTVCSDCDVFARNEVIELQKQIRVENSRFRFPSFEEVGGVWLRAVSHKERAISSELAHYLDAMPSVNSDTIRAIEIEIEKQLEDTHGSGYLQSYAESLRRRATGCGLSFRAEDHRFDLADAAYRASVANSHRQARRNVLDSLQLQLLQKGCDMNISSLMRDKLTVLKKDGTKIENLKAAVSSDSIIAAAEGVLIEPGDLLRRQMSNSAEETFEVIDPGFHEAFHGIPASYQMRVRKLGLPEAERAVQNVIYNLNGPNSRVNQNSIDNSANTVKLNPDVLELFEALRHELARLKLDESERAAANEIVDAAEHQVQSQKPSKVAVTALLAALPHAASIATIVTTIASLL